MVIVKSLFFEKIRFQNVFRPCENSKPEFLNSSAVESILQNLRFSAGLVCTEGLTVEIKLRF